MLPFNELVIQEFLKEGMKPTINRVLVAFDIVRANQTDQKLQEISKQLSAVRTQLQTISASLQRIENKIDQNRVAGLVRGVRLLHDASRMQSGGTSILEQSLVAFHDVTSLPTVGRTGKWENSELKALASFGAAAVHRALGNSDELVSEYLTEGFLANSEIAKAFMEPALFDKLSVLEVKVKPKVTFSFVSSHLSTGLVSISEDDSPIIAETTGGYFSGDLLFGEQREMTVSPGSHNYTIIFQPIEEARSEVCINAERCKAYLVQIKHEFNKNLWDAVGRTKEKLNIKLTEKDYRLANFLLIEVAESEFGY